MRMGGSSILGAVLWSFGALEPWSDRYSRAFYIDPVDLVFLSDLSMHGCEQAFRYRLH